MFLPRTLLTKKSGDTSSETAKRKVDPISASAVKKPKKTGFSAAEPPPSPAPAPPLVSPPSAPRTATTIAGALAAAGAGMSALDAMNLRMELEQAKSMAKAKLMASQMSAQASMRIQQLNFMGLGSRTPVLPLMPMLSMAVRPSLPPQAPASEVEFTVERRPMTTPSAASSSSSLSTDSLSVVIPSSASSSSTTTTTTATTAPIPPLSPDSKAKLPLSPYFPQFTGCRSVQRYQKIKPVAQGTYGTVYKAKDNYSGDVVALKRFKRMESGDHGFPKHFLCEINILTSVKHRNLIGLREVVLGRGELDKADVFLVLDWAEHDLQSIMRKMSRPFTTAECKCLMRQLLRAVHALDSASVMHRDLKPANLLYDMNEARLMVCDLGEARRYSDGDEKEAHTPGVISLRYRAPEVLMGSTSYDSKVDMWGVGCIFGKLLSQADLIPGTTEIEMLSKMFALLGTPTEESWPGFKDTPFYSKHAPTEVLTSKLRERFQPEEVRFANLNSSSRGGGSTPSHRLGASATPNARSGNNANVTPSARNNSTPSNRANITPSGRNNNATPSGRAGTTPDLMRAGSTPSSTTMCPPLPRLASAQPVDPTSGPNASPLHVQENTSTPATITETEVEEGELNDSVVSDPKEGEQSKTATDNSEQKSNANPISQSGSAEVIEQDLLESFLADIEGMDEKEDEEKPSEKDGDEKQSGKEVEDEKSNQKDGTETPDEKQEVKAPEEDDCEEPGQPVAQTGENDDTPMGSPCYLSDLGFDLLTKFLQYDPSKRISAKEALRHPFFKEAPLALLRKDMPKFFEVKE